MSLVLDALLENVLVLPPPAPGADDELAPDLLPEHVHGDAASLSEDGSAVASDLVGAAVAL